MLMSTRAKKLHPLAWLRKTKLDRALQNYPIYEPPHKKEERLLRSEQAAQNFDYFMAVKAQRLTHFQQWLRQHFNVTLTLDERGIEALSRWGNRYAGLLIASRQPGDPTDAYFSYVPSWNTESLGCNVVFDMGIALGEAVIAACPNLRWDHDPISAVQPRMAKQLRSVAGSGFQRPMLTGFANPAFSRAPLSDVFMFAHQMNGLAITFDGLARARKLHKKDHDLIDRQLINEFVFSVNNYPDGDPYGDSKSMPKID